MIATPTVREAGKRGGVSRSHSLTPERKREIALAASRGAVLKRRGLPAQSDLIKAYVRQLREEDPELARFVELIAKLPEKYSGVAFVACLSDEEQRLALRIGDQVFGEMLGRKE